MSNFSFVTDKILRSNLDTAFDHVVDLLTLSESEQYKGKTVLVSCLRKTIIIHTASIIEALLLWSLKALYKSDMAIMHDDWKYLDIKVIHTIDENQEVVAGTRKRETRILDKLDFVRITDLCEKNKIIKTKGDRESLDNVRKLRNRLHIGGLIEIEKEYRKEDLEFCFSVAKKVKNLAVKVSLQK